MCEAGEWGREYVEVEYVEFESVSLVWLRYLTYMRESDSESPRGSQRAHMNVAVGSS